MLKPILLVEDNPRDLELTLLALERSQLANEVIVLRDGAEALDYLLRRNAYVVKPVEFKEFVAAISDLGVFWAVLNEPPPGTLRLNRRGSN